jgi:hypothetical protein
MSRSIMGKRSLAQSQRSWLIDVLQQALEEVDSVWWWAEGLLQEIGVLPRPRPSYEPVEDVVQETLRPVEPSDTFRQSLRNDLAFAAHRRDSGLIVEPLRPFREGLVLGVVFGFIAILGTTLLVALWPRQHARRSPP